MSGHYFGLPASRRCFAPPPRTENGHRTADGDMALQALFLVNGLKPAIDAEPQAKQAHLRMRLAPRKGRKDRRPMESHREGIPTDERAAVQPGTRQPGRQGN